MQDKNTDLSGRKFGQIFLGDVCLAEHKVGACLDLSARVLGSDQNFEGPEVVRVREQSLKKYGSLEHVLATLKIKVLTPPTIMYLCNYEKFQIAEIFQRVLDVKDLEKRNEC